MAGRPAGSEGTKWTPRRLFNYHLARREFARGRTRLRSYPLKLTVESTSVCNLRCPACFTGIGEASRRRGAVPPEFSTALMDVLGPYLLEVEFTNWGEPLLNQHLEDMVEVAARSGTTTSFSTNFSFPFTPQRAERLVRSGLTSLGVSIDGARQETYEQYRVGGDLALVLRNCELVQDAKRRLGSRTPRLVWGFTSFPTTGKTSRSPSRWHASAGWTSQPPRLGNRGRLGPGDAVHRAARDGTLRRALVPGRGSQRRRRRAVLLDVLSRRRPRKARYLTPANLNGRTFREIWSGPHFESARRLFADGRAQGGGERTACDGCPVTIEWHDWRRHEARGGTRDTFRARRTQQDLINFFWNRRPRREETAEEVRRGVRCSADV
jgi:Radical SAM superfamily